MLSSLIARPWVGLQTLWQFLPEDLSIDGIAGAWYLAVCHANRGLPVGFFLLWCSVLFAVESLSLLYHLFISWFICSKRWSIDKLEVFHANQIYISWSTSDLRVRLALWNKFKPSSKLFILTVPRRYFFCGPFMFVLCCVCYAFVRVCLFVHCGHLLGKSWPLGSRLWCLTVILSLFPLVSWIRWGTWLHRFLIFAPLLNFISQQGCKMHFMPKIS